MSQGFGEQYDKTEEEEEEEEEEEQQQQQQQQKCSFLYFLSNETEAK